MLYRRYPKLTTLALFYAGAILLAPVMGVLAHLMTEQLGSVSAFILGFLYSFSFAGGFATLMLVSYESFSLWYVFLAALGALCADFALIRFIQLELTEEFTRLFKEPFMKHVMSYGSWFTSEPARVALAIFCIGSPLPDELGVLLLAQIKDIPLKYMLALSFCANFVGMYLISQLS